ncbi:MAG: hypothetical protein CMJ67_01380 [Planctomycetaceae bacterium]|nr:hypothetical protein [Planctomycetaceae bacterium]
MKFNDFRLDEPILRAVEAEGYEHPSPIQAGVIPPALEGRDILGTAQTGTGKTAAFALPILHRLAAGRAKGGKRSGGKGPPRGRGRSARALVLCPTRELAAQILDSFATYGKGLPLSQTAIYGGVGQGRQVDAIRNGLDTLVATPGRLMDLMGQGHLDLSRIETVVLDEADRMLDMGFIHPIRKIMAEIPRERQTMLLSATISPEIRVLADDLLRDPVVVATAPESSTAELVDQRIYLVEKANKPKILIRMFEHGDMARTLVFTRTKYGADRLVRVLKKAGIKAEAIHGDKSQGQRTRAMNAFRSGKAEALVATDVAARGIDVDGVSHVVNYDMPVEPESYVHRIGRTARAGASGEAVSLCDRHELELLRAIERRTDARPHKGEGYEDLTYDMPTDGGRAAAKAAREAKTAAAKARFGQRTGQRKGHKSSHSSGRPSGSGTKKPRTNDQAREDSRAGADSHPTPKPRKKPDGSKSFGKPKHSYRDDSRTADKPSKPGKKGAGKFRGKPGAKPTGKPTGKPGSKPAGKAGSKPRGKAGGKTAGKTGGKFSGKFSGKAGSKPGGKRGTGGSGGGKNRRGPGPRSR